jgi:DNA-binding PadR family transcriptional regulator
VSLRNALLGVLSLREMSGYDIKRNFDRAVHFVWNASDSQIYRELRSMEKDGLITSRLVHQEGKPNKRLYQLTSDGVSCLDDWLVSPVESPYGKDSFLMRLFFMGRVAPEEALQTLKERREEVVALLDAAKERRERFGDLSRTELPQILWWQVRLIDGFQMIHSAQLDWIDGLIADVEAGRVPTPPSTRPPSKAGRSKDRERRDLD